MVPSMATDDNKQVVGLHARMRTLESRQGLLETLKNIVLEILFPLGLCNHWSSQATTRSKSPQKNSVFYPNCEKLHNYLELALPLTKSVFPIDSSHGIYTFRAYKSYISKAGRKRSTLPGLNLTDEQLYFVSDAQFYCEKTSPSAFDGINVRMANDANFAKAFKCPEGAPLNPKSRCTVFVRFIAIASALNRNRPFSRLFQRFFRRFDTQNCAVVQIGRQSRRIDVFRQHIPPLKYESS
uniref:Peptidase M13 C-terminal domain-containing protein n=1 Tax=Romanomermis culicivorax TaxID=13658 RepID=A0A915LA09_ROMCU